MRLLAPSFCDGCGARSICPFFQTEDRCWYPDVYGAVALHPAEHQLEERFIVPFDPPREWARIPVDSMTLPVFDRQQVEGIDAYGLSLKASLSQLLGRPRGKAAALFTFGNDATLEKLRLDRGRLRPPTGMVAVSPVFSTWNDRTHLEHIIECIRTTDVMWLLSRHAPVVPSIPLTRSIHFGWWRDFLMPGKPPDVAVDLGTKPPNDWPEKLAVVREIREMFLPHRPRLVAYGVTNTRRILDIFEVWGTNVLFASPAVAMAAHAGGERLDPENLRRSVDLDRSRAELVVVNTRVYEEVVRRLAIDHPRSIGLRQTPLRLSPAGQRSTASGNITDSALGRGRPRPLKSAR